MTTALVAKGPANPRAAPLVELTYNWDSTEDYGDARYFGHLAYEVDDIYALCDKLQKAGVTINRPPLRRHDGVRPLAGSPLDRASAKRRRAAAQGTVDLDAERRQVVSEHPARRRRGRGPRAQRGGRGV